MKKVLVLFLFILNLSLFATLPNANVAIDNENGDEYGTWVVTCRVHHKGDKDPYSKFSVIVKPLSSIKEEHDGKIKDPITKLIMNVKRVKEDSKRVYYKISLRKAKTIGGYDTEKIYIDKEVFKNHWSTTKK